MSTQRRRKGMVFIVALLAMLAMVAIGTTFVSSATQQLGDAQRDLETVQSIAMADAGLHYFIWKQRYTGATMWNAYSAMTNNQVMNLTPTGSPAPQIGTDELTFTNQQHAAVWMLKYLPVGGSSDCYQIVSKGYYRDHSRTLRAVLQGPIKTTNTIDYPWAKYAIFADSQMIIQNSTDIYGDIASNGTIVLNTSGGSNFKGSLRAASTVQLMKPSTSIDGGCAYGVNILDKSGKPLTDPSKYFTGSTAPIPNDQDKKLNVDGLDPQKYADWASQYGSSAYYNGTSLNDPGAVTTPILYVNAANATNFTLDIDCNIPGPVTIFVNGNIRMRGNVTVGTSTSPVNLIATGNIDTAGTPTIYGLAWAGGSFGNGTPKVYGSVRCSVLGNFKGNPYFNWKSYPPQNETPPDGGSTWSMGSWELL